MNKFLIGVVIGIAIAGGLAIYINNSPSQFTGKNVNMSSNTGGNTSSPMILSPAIKLQQQTTDNKNSASTPSFDFYQILQDKKVVKSDGGSNPQTNTPTPPKTTQTFYIQAGAFASQNKANDMVGQLALIGIEAQIKPENLTNRAIYRVILGPFEREQQAQKMIIKLSDQQIKAVLIKINN
jgi:cell division protein FtsN